MLAFLIAFAVIVGLAVFVGRGTAGSTGVVDRDAQRVGAELAAIAGYANDIGPGRH
ncbi:hypothetical protein [Nocardia mangyaensis]|uniref:hypothetical protein n=1 Tax=Nocardia mangyaensis TaxID=2213200 RepID=UPI002675BD6E|nr:hypothetical protein [Nocardia mangyaensis]MDO3650955.1 hypothetical protein [Nocardia mangyaensis]